MSFDLTYLARALEHAPKAAPGAEAGPAWTDGTDVVCSVCASRILARGCYLAAAASPLWDRPADAECALCNPTEQT